MQKKLMSWKTKGMNRDMSVSAFSPEFSFENRNLRLSTNEGNTMLSWVNEKGTVPIRIRWTIGENQYASYIAGIPLGTAVVGSKIVLFINNSISQSPDSIYVLSYTDRVNHSMTGDLLFSGNLGFNSLCPIETLVSYESENIQKVYWTDGINQPRMLVLGDEKIKYYSADTFDFVGKINADYEVKIKKVLGGGGLFAPGVIQYCFTYYRKHGHESNIFYTSPLYYISYRDRGGSGEDRIDNTFEITVNNTDYNRYDYLRIYSVQRTSINGTPIVKRIQDILLRDDNGNGLSTVRFTDNGMTGESIDPTELLYKGGESITAQTLEQKDGTLFLGNIKISRNLINKSLRSTIKNSITLSDDVRRIIPTGEYNVLTKSGYNYFSQLTSVDFEDRDRTVPCGGFRRGNKYRLGVQFQHETGKWSDPIFLSDKQIQAFIFGARKTDGYYNVSLPTFKGTIPVNLAGSLMSMGYIKVRGVVVFPQMQDRLVLCQGVCNPTLFTEEHRDNKQDLFAQPSWFFRPVMDADHTPREGVDAISPYNLYDFNHINPYLKYTSLDYSFCDGEVEVLNPQYTKWTEIQGHYEEKNRFRIDHTIVTFNSPDIEFDSQYQVVDYSNTTCYRKRTSKILRTLSDIEIQTETPSISSRGAGFIHKSMNRPGTDGIVSGLFYDDFLVDDHTLDNGEEGKDYDLMVYDRQQSSCKWMVYLWQKDGSLNNDINRPSTRGVASAVLKKKIISNLRYADDAVSNSSNLRCDLGATPQLFNSDQNTILKFPGLGIYRGNVDTVLTPDKASNHLFAFGDNSNIAVSIKAANVTTDFSSDRWWCTSTYYKFGWRPQDRLYSILRYDPNESAKWVNDETSEPEDIGGTYQDLVKTKEGVRMKYKSSPHLVLPMASDLLFRNVVGELPIVDLVRNVTNDYKVFGGDTPDALKENVWVPCGEPVKLRGDAPTVYKYSYGDTYFQRYDCLKTYAYTNEDINQVVEIGSFMLETYTNIDGRYDRNRGQQSNLYMRPENFNLLNPVYSQIDNFFSYRIQDDNFYEDTIYRNQIAWTKTKNSSADIDLWTNVTLANTMEMDGNKEDVTSIKRFNNELLVFQKHGLSQLLYNGNTLLSTERGVPVEIANSDKVQGKNYISNTIGCSNKWSIVTTPAGVYFVDDTERSIYLFNGQLQNLSVQKGFNSWVKSYIPQADIWNPKDFGNFVSYYDKQNQDVLFINKNTALAYSEKFGVFTSFYDYGSTPFFCNLNNNGIWIKPFSYIDSQDRTRYICNMWQHQEGEYCDFFGVNKPYSITLVGNPEPKADCIFTNIEFRSNVEGEGSFTTPVDVFDKTFDNTFHPKDIYAPFLPFNFLETWNEYQHGYATLSYKNGKESMQHHLSDATAHLDRKFRIWRCDIPRDNLEATNNQAPASTTWTRDVELGITRFAKHPMDRMRNPWLYIKLEKKADRSGMKKAEIHDLVMTYYG